MNSILSSSKEYLNLKRAIASERFPIALFGYNENAFIQSAVTLASHEGRVIILASSDVEARNLFDRVSSIYDNCGLYLTPEINHFDEIYHSKQLDIQRLESLYKFEEDGEFILIMPVSALTVGLSSPDTIYNSLDFKCGENYDFDGVIETLVERGYERMDIVEAKGQFAVKGGIIDVFPLLYADPVRLDFFGDELYQIKPFKIESQISYDNLNEFTLRYANSSLEENKVYREAALRLKGHLSSFRKPELEKAYTKILEKLEFNYCAGYPLKLLPFTENGVFSLFQHLKGAKFLAYGFSRQLSGLEELSRENEARIKEDLLEARIVKEQVSMYIGFEDILTSLQNSELIIFNSLKVAPKYIVPHSVLEESFRDLPNYYGDLTALRYDLSRWEDSNYKVLISAEQVNDIDKLKNFFYDEDIHFTIVDGSLNSDELKKGIYLLESPIMGGFLTESSRLVLLTSIELFGKRVVKRKKVETEGKRIKAFSEIEVGDYVVHESYGIGKYHGIVLKEAGGEKKDMIQLEYAQGGTLFVPVERLDTLSKYMGKGIEHVKLSSLSSTSWQKQKQRVKRAVEEVAEELIELYRKRRNSKGHAFPADDIWQAEFEEAFPFQETEGQLRSAFEIKEDMQKPYPMERLLCGDVGYGKTEVALRAIFKAITNGKQAAVLVPTTILAEQHYISMKSRFANFPVEVASLSRFKSQKEIKDVLSRLKDGRIDLVIGTHRLLSKDVQFKDLGLLVIDEEQRFGVGHKEKIKELKIDIDSLSMSATPIPRTLNMSLIGVKDLSIIEDPPENRFPIQTYVMEDDDAIIRTAIMREIARGGQVYYVHNRIEDIFSLQERVQKICPEARIDVAHGRLEEKTLERLVYSFMQAEFDVLITTTIIETGVDIPNVNTIIIDECDKFGLSQLYQLRGRVGRMNRLAYAYLMYKKDKVLSEQSEKRLQAIKEFSSLGSGFKLSMRDLEIRGSGNLFGKAQSGHMEAVGYEMYVKMLEDAVLERKGEKKPEIDCKVELNVTAFISDDYIPDYRFKLEMYKLIASISSIEGRDRAIMEIEDRFGSIPQGVVNLTYISLIRKLASLAGFDLLVQDGKQIKMYYSSEFNLDLKLIYDILSEINDESIEFVAEKNPYFKFKIDPNAEESDMFESLVEALKLMTNKIEEKKDE